MRRLTNLFALVAAALLFAGEAGAAPGAEREYQAELPEQTSLVQRALADLAPSPQGASKLYFVGFAGYGFEAVFKREVLAVRKLFDERFGTAGRSVILINHPSTLGDTPLATRENLEQVLQGMDRVMHDKNDTLFLFLTSHGERSLLAVEMPHVGLEHLTPRMLKAMLGRTSIRNRVIVVSACHSGSFIPALADARTLVIAAARSDRTSFGCNDKREWTYFGEAYFNQALRRERSFRRAFEHAAKLISAWETKEKLMPSLPQMKGGEALRLSD